MSAFAIFALVLTFGYVVYFTIVITMDLHQNKDTKKPDEENFDVRDMGGNPEEPTAVSEDLDSPDGGTMSYTDQTDDEGLRIVAPSGNVTPVIIPEESQDPEPETEQTPDIVTSEELNEVNEENMEEIETEYQISMEAEDFIGKLNEKHNLRKIEKKNVIDNL